MAQALIDSPVGPLFIDATERGIRLLSFLEGYRHVDLLDKLEGPMAAERPGDTDPGGEAVVEEARRQLDEYFEGRRREFDLTLDFRGTEFQKRVWRTIAAIPFGATATYGEVAASAGAPSAYRAAGSACGANPIVLVVPCHRVVGSDRGLHGFGGGLDTKVWLLRHEGSLAGIKSGGWVAKKAAAGQRSLI